MVRGRMSDDSIVASVPVRSAPLYTGWADFGGLALCIAFSKIIANVSGLVLGLRQGLGLPLDASLLFLSTVGLAVGGGFLPAIYCRRDRRRLQIALFFLIISPAVTVCGNYVVGSLITSMHRSGYSNAMVGSFLVLVAIVRAELVAILLFGVLIILRAVRPTMTTVQLLSLWLFVNPLIAYIVSLGSALAGFLPATGFAPYVLPFAFAVPGNLIVGYILSCMILENQCDR